MPSDHDDSHFIEAVALAATVQQLQDDLATERARAERAEQRLAAITEVMAEHNAAEIGDGLALYKVRALLDAPTEDDQILRLTAEAEPRSPESAAAIEHVLRETYDRLAHPDAASDSPCPTCGGTGEVPLRWPNRWQSCPDCTDTEGER